MVLVCKLCGYEMICCNELATPVCLGHGWDSWLKEWRKREEKKRTSAPLPLPSYPPKDF
jgi:hypothetical protein